jgi:hypothetical protein
MPVKKEARELVTDHVIVRWLERVEGYDFDDVRTEIEAKGKKVTDTRILNHLAETYGLFRGHVIYRIATKAVRAAVKAGAKRINRDRWTLFVKGGQVVTLTPRKR